MNINNFFKFVGDKFPEYRLSSDNERLRDIFYLKSEEAIQEEGDSFVSKNSPFFAIAEKGILNADGTKTGQFVQYTLEGEKAYSPKNRNIDYGLDLDTYDFDFNYFETHINFKNDIIDGQETIYKTTNPKNIKKISDREYRNNKKIKKTIYRYFENLKGNKGPYIDNVVYYNDNGDEIGVDHYRFISKNNGTEIIGSELSYRNNYIAQNGPGTKQRVYFDKNGNEISKEQWEHLMSSNPEGYR